MAGLILPAPKVGAAPLPSLMLCLHTCPLPCTRPCTWATAKLSPFSCCLRISGKSIPSAHRAQPKPGQQQGGGREWELLGTSTGERGSSSRQSQRCTRDRKKKRQYKRCLGGCKSQGCRRIYSCGPHPAKYLSKSSVLTSV